MKLLIVEEVPALRRLIRSSLDGMDLTVSECHDGRELLAACAAQQPDWVLLDLNLSDTDALAAARHIGAAHPGARVVVISDDDNLLMREAARAAGVVGYVMKENLLDLRQTFRADVCNYII